jgi:5-methylcytosine-specific restriction endonuclease McrA
VDKARQPDTGEFVTYHSERTVGSQYSGTGQDFSFFSAKSEKVLQNALGRRVWVITSVGQKSPRYFLAGHYIPSRITQDGDVLYVEGKGMHLHPYVEISHLDWFRALFAEQNNFSYGNFSRIRSDAIVRGLEETWASSAATIYPDELQDTRYFEGLGQQITVNRYERNIKARDACLEHFGTSCFVCGLDLRTRYGDVAKDLIHVHHTTPIASINASYEVNPEKDLIPICPNCHAVAHRKTPPLTPAEIRKLLKENSHS